MFAIGSKIAVHSIRLITISVMVYSHCTTPRTRPRPIKMACIGLCGGIHTAQTPITTQIPIGFCILVIGIGLGLGLVLGQCDCTITMSTRLERDLFVQKIFDYNVEKFGSNEHPFME